MGVDEKEIRGQHIKNVPVPDFARLAVGRLRPVVRAKPFLGPKPASGSIMAASIDRDARK